MASVAYIIFVTLLCAATFRYAPERKARPEPGVEGILMLSFYLFGGAIGWYLPAGFQEYLQWAPGPGWLSRSAQVIGALCGVLIAMRGFVIWASILGLGLILFLAVSVLGWIASGGAV